MGFVQEIPARKVTVVTPQLSLESNDVILFYDEGDRRTRRSLFKRQTTYGQRSYSVHFNTVEHFDALQEEVGKPALVIIQTLDGKEITGEGTLEEGAFNPLIRQTTTKNFHISFEIV